MYSKIRKWYDRASDIAADFDYRDFLLCELFVFSIGIIFGISTKKAAKYITPIIIVFAAFSAFEVLYPRRQKIYDMASGKYEDKFVEFSNTEDIPDFI